MYTLESQMDALCGLLRDGTKDMRLKAPNDRDVTEISYEPPSIYPIYLPQSGALTGQQYPKAPSVVVMPSAVVERGGAGTMPVTLAIVTYDPGTRDDGALVDLNNDGWRSLTTLISAIQRTLRKAGYIGGMVLTDDMRVGVYDSKNTDLRPYYVGWIELKLSYHYEVQSQSALDLLN